MRLPEPDPPLCGRHKWMAPYAYFLHEIIFNIFCQEIFQWFFCFLIELKKMFKMSSFRLDEALEVLAPLGHSIVDNPLIQIHPHTRLHSSHMMASKQSRFEYGPL